jgi:hypothetical protein
LLVNNLLIIKKKPMNDILEWVMFGLLLIVTLIVILILCDVFVKAEEEAVESPVVPAQSSETIETATSVGGTISSITEMKLKFSPLNNTDTLFTFSGACVQGAGTTGNFVLTVSVFDFTNASITSVNATLILPGTPNTYGEILSISNTSPTTVQFTLADDGLVGTVQIHGSAIITKP